MGRNLRLQGDGLCQNENSDIAENCEERGTSESQSLWKPLTQNPWKWSPDHQMNTLADGHPTLYETAYFIV